MKKAILILILIASYSNVIAQYEQNINSFDKAINLTMGSRKGDNNVNVQFGVLGRKIPLSFLVGGHYMEFDETGKGMGLNTGKCGVNGSVMLRVFPFDAYFMNRTIDFNVYGTSYFNKGIAPLYEYGGKVGIMINTRSRIYVNAGTIRNDKYNSFCFGATFSLLFFNGYSAY
jgi:hypothetical protein